MPNQKTIVLGVTGCIAAYKSCEIVRALQKEGYRVKVVMTEHATKFVGETTFRALTDEQVAVGLFDDPSDPIHHISLAHEADAFLIAPCTANVLAKLACGIADDLLTTTALATTAPIILAPAMNVNMYENVATQKNIATLKARGFQFIEPDDGYLACGDVGKGRLAPPEGIVAGVELTLCPSNDLQGKKILITAGPTIEPIDPVRFISNHSSGKTGYALASAAARRGANVTLVSGPVALQAPQNVHVVKVKTACEMHKAAAAAFPDCDIAIFAAAVADMRPVHPADRKLKKGSDDVLGRIELVENPDILATLASAKTGQFVIGFAAETDDVERNGEKKLASKHADMIVANEVGDGKAFGTEENSVLIITDQDKEQVPYLPKDKLADVILDKTLANLA